MFEFEETTTCKPFLFQLSPIAFVAFLFKGYETFGSECDGCVLRICNAADEDVIIAERKVVMFGKSACLEEQILFVCEVSAVSHIGLTAKGKSDVVYCRSYVVVSNHLIEQTFALFAGGISENDGFPFREVRHHVFQPIEACGLAVGVAQHHIVVFCSLYAQGNGKFSALELVYVLHDIHHLQVGIQFGKGFQNVFGIVCRSIVHDYNLKLRIILFQEKGKLVFQVVFLVLCRYNDGNTGQNGIIGLRLFLRFLAIEECLAANDKIVNALHD